MMLAIGSLGVMAEAVNSPESATNLTLNGALIITVILLWRKLNQCEADRLAIWKTLAENNLRLPPAAEKILDAAAEKSK